jgi:hypothetical protein
MGSDDHRKRRRDSRCDGVGAVQPSEREPGFEGLGLVSRVVADLPATTATQGASDPAEPKT